MQLEWNLQFTFSGRKMQFFYWGLHQTYFNSAIFHYFKRRFPDKLPNQDDRLKIQSLVQNWRSVALMVNSYSLSNESFLRAFKRWPDRRRTRSSPSWRMWRGRGGTSLISHKQRLFCSPGSNSVVQTSGIGRRFCSVMSQDIFAIVSLESAVVVGPQVKGGVFIARGVVFLSPSARLLVSESVCEGLQLRCTLVQGFSSSLTGWKKMDRAWLAKRDEGPPHEVSGPRGGARLVRGWSG